jgi:hypothetical protein
LRGGINCKIIFLKRIKFESWEQWLIPVTSTTWEVEIGVSGQPGKSYHAPFQSMSWCDGVGTSSQLHRGVNSRIIVQAAQAKTWDSI